MHYTLSISAICLAAAVSPLAALAQDRKVDNPCKAYSPLLSTLSTVRSIQASPQEAMSAAEYGALSTALEDVSLADVYGEAGNAELAAEYTSTFIFIDNLRTAVGYYDFGDTLVAGMRTNAAVPKEVGAGLAELLRRDGCNMQNSIEEVEEIDRAASGTLNVGAGHSNASSTEPMRKKTAPTIGAETSSHTDQSNLQQGPLQQGRKIFGLSPGIAAIVALGLLLAWLSRSLFRRRKTSKPHKRQQRQLCNKPVRVRIGERTTVLTIVDISNQGMKLKHNSEFEGVSRFEFKVDNKWLRATITWRNKLYAGAKFARQLRGSEVRILTWQHQSKAKSKKQSKASPAAVR